MSHHFPEPPRPKYLIGDVVLVIVADPFAYQTRISTAHYDWSQESWVYRCEGSRETLEKDVRLAERVRESAETEC